MNKSSRKREATRLRVQRFRAVRQKVNATNEVIDSESSTTAINYDASPWIVNVSPNLQNGRQGPIIDSTSTECMDLNNADDVSIHSDDFEQLIEMTHGENEDDLQESDRSILEIDSDSEKSRGLEEVAEKIEEQVIEDEIVELWQWAMQARIPQTQLDELLKILRRRLLPDLPAPAKTFLKTTSALYQLEKLTTEDGTEIGEFVYFGIAKNLQGYVNTDLHEECLKLQFNIDGLPLFKSSAKQFWPILCKVRSKPDVYAPFPVAVYAGNQKPDNLNQYLERFIEEINSLQLNGIDIDGKKLKVQIDCFICDTPARSFVKCTKGHGGYYACERCTLRGERFEGRTIYNSTNSEERTDTSFREQKDADHHNGKSPLTKIKGGFDMVLLFLLDFMHLVCLGVMKKMFVHCWLKRNKVTRLSQTSKSLLSKLLLGFQSQVPQVFQRTTRSISDIERWKATEYRFFLLYCGPILLRKILPKHLYEHFLLLHAACRILCSNELACKYNAQAKAYLISFVGLTRCYYGKQNLVLNVHNLIHLADDAKNMQCSVSDITAFPFENTLGQLKKMIRSGNRPLAQLCRRLYETFFANRKKPTLPPEIEISKQGKTTAMFTEVTDIKKLQYKQALLTTSAPDNTVLLQNGKVLRISGMTIDHGQDLTDIQVTGHILKIDKPIFTFPCDSAMRFCHAKNVGGNREARKNVYIDTCAE